MKEKLKTHFGHDIVVARYRNNKDGAYALECQTCNEVLLDDHEEPTEVNPLLNKIEDVLEEMEQDLRMMDDRINQLLKANLHFNNLLGTTNNYNYRENVIDSITRNSRVLDKLKEVAWSLRKYSMMLTKIRDAEREQLEFDEEYVSTVVRDGREIE